MIKFGTAEFRTLDCTTTEARHVFHVQLAEGEWPSDADLLSLFYGTIPPLPAPFGGYVVKDLTDPSKATVSVNRE